MEFFWQKPSDMTSVKQNISRFLAQNETTNLRNLLNIKTYSLKCCLKAASDCEILLQEISGHPNLVPTTIEVV